MSGDGKLPTASADYEAEIRVVLYNSVLAVGSFAHTAQLEFIGGDVFSSVILIDNENYRDRPGYRDYGFWRD